jgi:hypothetical protein
MFKNVISQNADIYIVIDEELGITKKTMLVINLQCEVNSPSEPMIVYINLIEPSSAYRALCPKQGSKL